MSKKLKIPVNSQIIRPQAGGQLSYFKKFKVDEVLFGGAAGPGKSWSLIIDALGLQYKNTKVGKTAVEISDYRAVIFRRKTTQLAQLIKEARRYYLVSPFNAEYVAKRTGAPGASFIFPSGATIYFAHLENTDDVENHQGQEYGFVGFDELSQFTLYQYTYLLTRLRTTIPHFHTRMRATTNPTGAGLIWVKKRFINYNSTKLEPSKVYYFKHDFENDMDENPAGIMTEKGDPEAKSRCFVPGTLYENKILMNNDPNYELNIKAMGKRMTAALLLGDWDAFAGSFFDEYNKDKLIDPFKIDSQWELFAGLDPGYSSATGFILMARDFVGDVYCLFSYKVSKRSPDQHAKDIRERIKGFPYTDRFPEYCATDPSGWAKRDRNALISNELTFVRFFETILPEIYFKRGINDRVSGWWSIKQLMGANKFFIFKGFNDSLTDELLAAEADEKNPEDIDKETSSTFHLLDTLRYGIMSIQTPDKIEEEKGLRSDDIWSVEPKKDYRKFW
jgi:hypothetical protein